MALSFAQEGINFTYESKYGDGTNVDDNTNQETPYKYFENLLDMNFNYNNLFFYTQLEYSNSPVYGIDRIKIEDLANTYFAEYSRGSLMAKYGHIQTLYGYGLSVNMFQDQTTDFDNRVKGWELRYSPYDIIDLFLISGKGNYGTKSNGGLRVNDLLFDHELDLLGTQLYTALGDVSLIYSKKTTHYSSGIYNSLINSDTRLSIDLQDYWLSNLGEAWDSISSLDSEVALNSFNIGYSNTLGNFDIYLEYDINTYNKILRDEDVDGNSKFVSVATNFKGIDFLYEFKDYDMVYYMPITSNPPLVFNETSSVLISRNQHSIDFSDEIGHQFESRFNYKDISFLMNLSIGRKHGGVRNLNDFEFDDDFNLIYGTYQEPTFSDLLDMDFLDEDLRAHKPFRDFYIEASGFTNADDKEYLNSLISLTNDLVMPDYYKVGLHSHYSYDNASGKNYQSISIPMQLVYTLENNNSWTIYYEQQWTDNLFAIGDTYDNDSFYYDYMSLSYHIDGFGSISYFRDDEKKTFSNDMESQDSWEGVELTYELSSSMQYSIFMGSQKGGLVCANGICAVQPSFEDGVKVTLRALF